MFLCLCATQGKYFPSRPGYKLLVEARFSGESLVSDPVSHATGGRIELSTELAWEMTRKALQECELQKTSIELMVSHILVVSTCTY